MEKNRFLISVLLAGCAQAFSPAFAQDQTVLMTTEKPVGSSLAFMVNRTNGVTVDWGDGTPVSYVADSDGIIAIEGVTKGASIVLKSEGGRIEMLACGDCGLTALDVTAAPELRSLYCQNNSLTKLDLSAQSKLTDLNCANNGLVSTSFPLSGTHFPKLETLNASGNQLSGTFKVATSTLQQVNVSDNNYSILYVTSNPNLDVLKCSGNSLKNIYLTSSPKTSAVVCHDNNMTALYLPKAGLPELRQLVISNNALKTLDVSLSENLSELLCDNNFLTEMLLPANVHLNSLDCSNNNLAFYSLPASNMKPANFSYKPQGVLTVTGGMATYNGVPYIDQCPSYAERTNAAYVLDLSDYRYDGGGKLATVTFTWYAVNEDGTTTELQLAKATAQDLDYYNDKGKFSFLTGQSQVYAKLSSKVYSDLELLTDTFAVGKENITGITNVKAANNGLEVKVSGNTVYMTAGASLTVNIYTVDGKRVWSGLVGQVPVSVVLPKGVYLLNGKKILI